MAISTNYIPQRAIETIDIGKSLWYNMFCILKPKGCF